MDCNIDSQEFDVMKYFNSNPDTQLPLYEDFDFDFDNILSDSGAVVDNDCDHFTPNDIQVKMVGDSKYSNFNNKERNISLNVPEVNLNPSSKRHRLVVPLLKVTDEIRNNIERLSDPLVVHLKCRTDGEMQDNSSQVKGSDESPVAQQPADYNFNCLNQVVNGNLEDELEEFVHFKGNNLLPTREGVFKLENVTNLNLSVTRPNISFNVVRLICGGKRGLLPKVQNSPIFANKKLSERNTLLDRRRGRSSITAKKNKKTAHKTAQIVPNNCIQSSQNVRVEEINSSDSQKILNGYDINQISMNGNLYDLSKYPKFKIRYMLSLKQRLERINNLCEPVEEVAMKTDEFVSDCERMTMPEFFHSSQLTSRYINIRNYILECWKDCRPLYVSKKLVRDGLRHCGDVNLIGLVHRFLERVGAINFQSSPSYTIGSRHNIRSNT